jgi:hypothetical protein
MSLYGSLPSYNEGVVKNAELAIDLYPGWTLRVYVDETVPRDTIVRLSRRPVEIVNVTAESLGPRYGRFWRFWVAGDANLDRFIVRDAGFATEPSGGGRRRRVDRVGKILPTSCATGSPMTHEY